MHPHAPDRPDDPDPARADRGAATGERAVSTIAVVGAGAFGTALAQVESVDGGSVRLWARDAAAAAAMNATRENAARLPGIRLNDSLEVVADLAALGRPGALLLALPAQVTGDFLAEHGHRLPDCPVVACAKGLSGRDFRRQSEIVARALPGRACAVLTGPGFAAEIARGLPTALTIACADAAIGRALQERLSTRRLRLYLTDDVTGAELGGALKNVVALACGMVEGRGLGQSARAALMTRGYAEMSRLADAMGARPETLGGLSGLGDLSLTCNSVMSRNFATGRALGAGAPRPGGTVEGVATARAACELGRRHGVEMPIAEAVAAVLDGTLTLGEAIEALLTRPLKEE
jgi:glycerol-3-phosphate dehydrogenase (NAD(P)+)